MTELTWGIPNWAWLIIGLQVVTLYNLFRVLKWQGLNYVRIMRQCGADIPPAKMDDFIG